ncbi:MAG TPA: hypothetical protein DCQ50_16785 [Chryseobacterium sp.]|nr:hypothetical protein [Chryseobacterium sp.]
MTIGEKIKIYRQGAGLTQEEFAKNLNISRYFLGLIERDEKELSDATASLLLNLISESEVPKTFKSAYQEGRNFAKIIETLRNEGISLNQLRDEDFKVKGSDLSCMYLGMKEIPSGISKVLDNKYGVNTEFIKLGKKVPIFKNTKVEDSDIEFPYFQNFSALDAIIQYNSLLFADVPKIILPNMDVDFFLDIFGDNTFPTFKGREILGVKFTSLDNINYGSLYLILTKKHDAILRRIFPNNSDNSQYLLRKEDAGFPEIAIDKKEIGELYRVKTIVNPYFY